jgi:hypothetical protein
VTGFGPFQVVPEQVERVRGGFTSLINQLLAVEVQRAGMSRYRLQVDYQGNVADGGVDARLEAEQATAWLPAGVSAWQFKAGDLPPAKCKEELRGATWAKALVSSGAVYTLVVGKALTPQKVEARRKALLEEAAVLGLSTDPERYRVYDANLLAAWLSEFPALAVRQLLGGGQGGAYDFEYWSSLQWHQWAWTATAARDAEIAQIRADLDAGRPVGLRVSGVSGLGKTRLVMEALRGTAWEPLVAYVPSADELLPAFLAHTLHPQRAVILVVDECDARRHEKLVERVPVSSTIRIVTIGQDTAAPLSAPLLRPDPFSPNEIEEFLGTNKPALSPEGRRFVAAHAEGNVRFALLITERLEAEPEATAAELICRDDIGAVTGVLVPDGEAFFVSAVLALFERVGWDRDLAPEKDPVAAFAGVPTARLDAVARDLEIRGLLVRQGRYRAVGPHPVAIMLAAQAWRQEGSRIVTELLPKLSPEQALALLSRVAELGSYPPARDALRVLLGAAPLASLDAIEASGSGAVLIKLAMILPDEASEHLHRLLRDTPTESLRAHVRSRRDLVWTLEKLVWHSRLFRRAADSILRLALAENERYANNATGLWTSLFAAALPSTSAAPATRLAYLRKAGSVNDPEVRRLAVAAAQAALHPYESVIVSGELQGGTPVEPRGGVRSHQEADEYRASLVDFLAEQYHDDAADDDTRAAAAAALIGALHPLIDLSAAGVALTRALATLRPDDLPALRASIEQLRSLFREHPNPAVEGGLDAVEAALPPMTTFEAVRALTDLDPWTFQDEQRAHELREGLARLQTDGDLGAVLRWLQDRPVNGAWHLGHALASAAPGSETLSALVSGAHLNLAALAGYLAGRLDAGDSAAVTDFFTSDAAVALSVPEQLSLAVRLPATSEQRRRVLGLVERASVFDGAKLLFGWQRNLDAPDVASLLARWLGRIADQNDYNAVVDWVAGWFHRRTELPAELAAGVRELVLARRDHPDLGVEASDWTRLAGLIASSALPELARQVFALVADGLILHPGTPEGRLLTEVAADDPHTLWLLVAAQLEQDNWRLAMSVRGWLTANLPADVPIRWVDGRIDRARLVARIAAVGEDRLSPLASALLSQFGSDEEVQNALSADFVSGGWVGPWSGRIRHQLDLLDTWDEPRASNGVRSWIVQMKRRLNAELAETVEREAERGF